MSHFQLSRRSLFRIGVSAGLFGMAPGMRAAPVPVKRSIVSGPLAVVPLVIGHRGASALRPEHTLAAYARAIADGADFIEPDLVSTRDGVLIARHENNIAETTDVSSRPQFADRRVTKTIDGETVTGWFTEDFTLAEIKSLRAKERLGALRPESQSYDGRFQVATFAEIADFVAAEAKGRTVGIIPELKHSTYFASIGLPLEQRFLDCLDDSAYLRSAPVIVQSFEVTNLKWLRGRLEGRPNVELMQLTMPGGRPADLAASGLTFDDLHTDAGLVDVATYAHWISPHTSALSPAGLVARAHAAGLRVATWTFRPENRFLPVDLRDNSGDGARNTQGSKTEIGRYLALGVDAVFTDDPAIGRAAVDEAGY